jgi:hypothetical protein
LAKEDDTDLRAVLQALRTHASALVREHVEWALECRADAASPASGTALR